MQEPLTLSFLHTTQWHYTMGSVWGKQHPTSKISFICAQTSSTIGAGILQNLSLKGSSSMTLILCIARSVQPNSPGSKEKMSGYSTSRTLGTAHFFQTTPPGQITAVPGRVSLLLCSTDILVAVYPDFHLASPMFPSQPPPGHHIHGYYLSDSNALGNGDQSGSQVFHQDCNSLAPSSHLSIGIHDTQAVRQAGSITSFQGLHHHVQFATKNMAFVWACMIWIKSLYFL